jgi:glycerol-3-phosphate dehydrogenase
MPMPEALPLDAAIFGGGASGLWLLDALVRRGWRVLLLEAGDLGAGQTIASQGIIHGGFKYSLAGMVTPAARAVRDMPRRWRRAMAGEAQPDLRQVRLRASHCHLWQTARLGSHISMAGARLSLSVRPQALPADDRPPALRACPGAVTRIEEQVIDPASFLEALAGPNQAHLLKIDPDGGLEFQLNGPGRVEGIHLRRPGGGGDLLLRPAHVMLTAGAGNEGLRRAAGLVGAAMQRRPLHMVVARGDLPLLNGHCVDGAATRITVTSMHDGQGRTVWQVGGAVAEAGVDLEPAALVRRAVEEVQACLPGIDLRGVQWTTYRVDRAESRQVSRLRPALPCVTRGGNVLTGWPTKLALVPRLVDEMERALGGERRGPADTGYLAAVAGWPRPAVAPLVWEGNVTWLSGNSAGPRCA